MDSKVPDEKAPASDSLRASFAEAQTRALGLSQKPGPGDLLALYALYKQATVGDVSGGRPGMLDIKDRAKFDAWTHERGTSATAAMQKYIALVDRLASS